MIKVTVGTNTSREDVIVEKTTTIRSLLEDQHINYSNAIMHLDGSPLKPGDMDKTFEEIGISENCFLIAATKLDSGC